MSCAACNFSRGSSRLCGQPAQKLPSSRQKGCHHRHSPGIAAVQAQIGTANNEEGKHLERGSAQNSCYQLLPGLKPSDQAWLGASTGCLAGLSDRASTKPSPISFRIFSNPRVRESTPICAKGVSSSLPMPSTYIAQILLATGQGGYDHARDWLQLSVYLFREESLGHVPLRYWVSDASTANPCSSSTLI